jgi:hypothetical protein
MDADDAAILASELPDKGALTVLNLASNNLGELVPPDGWTKRNAQSREEYDAHGNVWYEHTDGTEQKEDPGSKPEGIIALANVIPDMGALSVLSLKSNCLCNKEAGKVLVEVLAANTVMKELDLSDNTGPGAWDGAGFAQELAVGIRDNGAMTKFDISNCSLMAEGGKALAAGLKGNQVLTELNVAENDLAILADRSDMDMSGVIALADILPDMRALLVLSLESNHLCTAGGKALADGLKNNQVITELNISSNRLGYKTVYNSDGADMSSVIALADVIPGMKAMSVLNLADNAIGGYFSKDGFTATPGGIVSILCSVM